LSSTEINRLLKKQIAKKFGPVEQLPKEMEGLIEAISQSYDRYDRDLELIERTMDLSSQELNEANEKMAQQTRQLETRNKELEQFAYIASHDLQEPLRTITSLVDLLSQSYQQKLDSSGQRMIKYLTEAAGRMSQLIKGLLDYSRIGRESVLTTVDLNKLLTEVKSDLTSAIIKSSAEIEINPLPTIQAYELELRLLFQNLLSNALKYNKPGVPPVIVVASGQQPTGGWKFTISDNGIGIADEFKEKIFIIFQRLHKKGEYEGTGIGLSHCMKIAELHKGRIWVESKPGEGSTFCFTINT
jgi:light-regulated signal transduction histidine kinase (bacteriophytochrome)